MMNRQFRNLLILSLVTAVSCNQKQFNVTGVVRDQASGQPVANAKVVATITFQTSRETFPAYFGTKTDSNGEFHILYEQKVTCEVKRMMRRFSLEAVSEENRYGILKNVYNGTHEIILQEPSGEPNKQYDNLLTNIKYNVNWNGKWIEQKTEPDSK